MVEQEEAQGSRGNYSDHRERLGALRWGGTAAEFIDSVKAVRSTAAEWTREDRRLGKDGLEGQDIT